MEVGGAQSRLLGVEVAEQAALQQRVVGKVDSRHDVGWEECDLFGFGEEVVGVAVQHHTANNSEGNDFFGDEFGGVKNVIRERVSQLLVEDLHGKVPLGVVARVDCFVEVASMKIGVCAGELDRFVPHGRLHAQLWAPVELHEG